LAYFRIYRHDNNDKFNHLINILIINYLIMTTEVYKRFHCRPSASQATESQRFSIIFLIRISCTTNIHWITNGDGHTNLQVFSIGYFCFLLNLLINGKQFKWKITMHVWSIIRNIDNSQVYILLSWIMSLLINWHCIFYCYEIWTCQ